MQRGTSTLASGEALLHYHLSTRNATINTTLWMLWIAGQPYVLQVSFDLEPTCSLFVTTRTPNT